MIYEDSAFNLSILSEHSIALVAYLPRCWIYYWMDMYKDMYRKRLQMGWYYLDGYRIGLYLRSRMKENEEYGTMSRYLYLPYLKSNASPYSQDTFE